MKNYKVYNYKEQTNSYYRQLIWENALSLFEKKSGMTEKSIIKAQKKFINSFDSIKGKNKYKTIEVLNNYFKNPNKLLATQIFWNTFNKKNIT